MAFKNYQEYLNNSKDITDKFHPLILNNLNKSKSQDIVNKLENCTSNNENNGCNNYFLSDLPNLDPNLRLNGISVDKANPLNSKKKVLVLGLNPSGYCYENVKSLFYFKYENEKIYDNNFRILYSECLSSKYSKYQYRKYFSTFYNIFKLFGYYPIHNSLDPKSFILTKYDCPPTEDNHNYFKNINSENCNKEIENSNIVVFDDLLNYRFNTGKEVEKILAKELKNCSIFSKSIIDRIDNLIGYVKPEIVLVANAFVSKFLLENWEYPKPHPTKIVKNNIVFYFVGMLTSGHTDDFSRQRLINEITFDGII